jgi:hypothetical protein
MKIKCENEEDFKILNEYKIMVEKEIFSTPIVFDTIELNSFDKKCFMIETKYWLGGNISIDRKFLIEKVKKEKESFVLILKDKNDYSFVFYFDFFRISTLESFSIEYNN